MSKPLINSEDYKLFIGRPINQDCTFFENKIYDFLDNLGIEYKTLKHPEAFTMEECQKVRDNINAPVAKNLFLTNKQQTKFYLLLMPANKAFKTKYLSSQINSARLSFATPEHMMQFLGVSPGSVTPLGLIKDTELSVNLLIDSDLKKENTFACHAGINSASVMMSFSDFINIVIPSTRHEIKYVSLPWEPIS